MLRAVHPLLYPYAPRRLMLVVYELRLLMYGLVSSCNDVMTKHDTIVHYLFYLLFCEKECILQCLFDLNFELPYSQAYFLFFKVQLPRVIFLWFNITFYKNQIVVNILLIYFSYSFNLFFLFLYLFLIIYETHGLFK